jgi:hypothetical protein
MPPPCSGHDALDSASKEQEGFAAARVGVGEPPGERKPRHGRGLRPAPGAPPPPRNICQMSVLDFFPISKKRWIWIEQRLSSNLSQRARSFLNCWSSLITSRCCLINSSTPSIRLSISSIDAASSQLLAFGIAAKLW